MSPIEYELQANAAKIKRLRNQSAIDGHQFNQHVKEAAAYSARWRADHAKLNQVQSEQNDLLFRLLTCGLSHRRVMQILRVNGC